MISPPIELLRPCRPDVPYGFRKRERKREGRETRCLTCLSSLAVTLDKREAIRSYFLGRDLGCGSMPDDGSYDVFFFSVRSAVLF